MNKTARAFRVAALLSAVSGASALLISGTTPAKAGEERLHSSSFKLYGLIPPGESNKRSANSDTLRTANAGTTSVKSNSKHGSGNSVGNEPEVEDPGLPGYDGPADGANNVAGGDGAVSG